MTSEYALNDDGHRVFTNGRLKATPACPCKYCRAVFEEWTEQAIGFQQWLNRLTPEVHDRYFGPEGVAKIIYVGAAHSDHLGAE